MADKLGTYISQLMTTVIQSEDDFVKQLAIDELNRLKVNIDEFLVKHLKVDDVPEKQTDNKQLLQEEK
tara:strand:+ start:709 stop:912 length:204 start_codon:yes stop_codon:yes gene_type:complete